MHFLGFLMNRELNRFYNNVKINIKNYEKVWFKCLKCPYYAFSKITFHAVSCSSM